MEPASKIIQFKVPQQVANPGDWQDCRCDKSYEWILTFQNWMRMVLFTIDECCHDPNCLIVLHQIKRELSLIVGDREVTPAGRPPHSVATWLIYNVPGVFPNDEGLELLGNWWGQLHRAKNKEAATKSQQEDTAESAKRLKKYHESRELLRYAVEVGAVIQRGAHFYFRGEHLGNGLSAAVSIVIENGHDLEADLRTDIAKGEGRK